LFGPFCFQVNDPADAFTTADKPFSGVVDGIKVSPMMSRVGAFGGVRDLSAGQDSQQFSDLIPFVVRRILELSMFKERIENPQVCMA
jgi:hypothetical protein